MVAGGQNGDGRHQRMTHGGGPHPCRLRHRPQRDAAPDGPRHVQRRQRAVEVRVRRLEVVRRGQHRTQGVVEAGQHPRWCHRIEPVDTEADETGDEEHVTVVAISVAAKPEEQQHERGHPEVHHEVVRRQQLRDVVVTAEPAVHRLRPRQVHRAVDVQDVVAMAERGAHDVTVQRTHLVVADREPHHQQKLRPPPRPRTGERSQVHDHILPIRGRGRVVRRG